MHKSTTVYRLDAGDPVHETLVNTTDRVAHQHLQDEEGSSRERVAKGKRRRNSTDDRGKKSSSRILGDSASKLVDILKDDSVRRNLHIEEFSMWEKSHKEEQLKILKDQVEIQRLQAQSFNMLAQAVASMAQAHNNP